MKRSDENGKGSDPLVRSVLARLRTARRLGRWEIIDGVVADLRRRMESR
jgi:hypothetical protein